MIRRFFRHLGESIKNLKRNLLSTLTAVFSVMIVLSLLGVFGSVILNTQKLASDIEKNIQVNVYLDPDSTDASETVKELSGQIVANKDYHKIYNALTKIKGVDKVTFSSKEEQKKQLIETMGSSFEMLLAMPTLCQMFTSFKLNHLMMLVVLPRKQKLFRALIMLTLVDQIPKF